jgi:hypothetical protein
LELNINSPQYYKAHYGIDDDIYRFCQQLYLFFKDKEYSDTLRTVGIIPIIAPSELYERGEMKEHVHMIGLNSIASIEIRMDFEKYVNADKTEKKQMYKDMIAKAIKKVKNKGKFDYVTFCKDLEAFANSSLLTCSQ